MKYKKQKKKLKQRIAVLDLKLRQNPLNASANAEYNLLVSLLSDLKELHETKAAAKTAQCICGFC